MRTLYGASRISSALWRRPENCYLPGFSGELIPSGEKYFYIFYIFSKTRPAGRHILNNIKNKASPKHLQPETHCASSRTGGYILAQNPKIFKTH
ncbi:hypothetical protein [Alistipes onderdonkii]|uniref:hypothetical protein n=1 Tax=Alistipes onderdonkii TaxID=328813 RepID=UPI001873B1BD|nr:hypothetical protein [Alistipes onderdonkii]MBE5046379.1 hypothetical protein [Alistipes onderdonkii]